MDKSTIEFKALNLLETLGPPRARPNAEARAALEAAQAQVWLGLPPLATACRELASQANTARGQSILWLLREKPAKAKGNAPAISRRAVETWSHELRAGFEGIAPQIELLEVVTAAGESVTVLHIETDRAPFVTYQGKVRRAGANVNQGAKSKPQATEVLWREGTEIRPIRRAELIRLITPLRDLPEFEIIVGELTFYENVNRKLDPRNAFHWSLDATVYIAPKDEKRWILPFRRAGVVLESSGSAKTPPFCSEALQVNLSSDREGTTIAETDSALLVHGVGQFYLFASGSTSREDPPFNAPLRLIFSLTPTGCTNAAVCAASLSTAPIKEDNQAGKWKLL